MAQFFSQDKIAEIQQASEISRVISEHITLTQRGRNFVGLCPFHHEKTPSFTVNPEKQFYKCFGCGEAGTVFTFLMKLKGMRFGETVRFLADRANITIPQICEEEKDEKGKSPLYNINSYFANFYHKNLLSLDEGHHIKKYILERGINRDSIEKFKIGYSPSSWDSLLREGDIQNFDIQTMEKAGLIIQKRNSSGFYDRFRNRLMFPIFNEFGDVTGFGARALGDSEAKYINSPESDIFSKRHILYGMNLAKNSIIKRQEAIIMEGYTDVIMAHQHGIDWSVGVMGTSLTSEHVKLLKRYCKGVILVLDGDSAGLKSADRCLDLIIEDGLDLKLVHLPEGLDPCDFITSKGKDSFIEQIEEADSFFDFKLKVAELSGNLSTLSDRAEVFDKIVSTAIKIPDILKRNLQIKEIAERLKIGELELRRHISKYSIKKTRSVRDDNILDNERLDVDSREQIKKDNSQGLRSKQGASFHVETEIVRLMLFNNKLIPIVRSNISLERFLDNRLRSVVNNIFDIYDKKGHISEGELFSKVAEPEIHEMVAEIISRRLRYTNEEELLEECIHFINRRTDIEEIKKTRERTISVANELKNNNKYPEYEKELNILLDKFHKSNKRIRAKRFMVGGI